MYVSSALLVLRLVIGLTLVGHGSQKLFGWFGGSGWQGWVGLNARMKLRPAVLWAFLGSISEFGGGLLLALGFLNPLGSLGIIAAMAMAMRTHRSKGFWAQRGGFEYPSVLLAVALAIALSGPGAYSADAVLGIALPEPASLVVGLVVVIVGWLAAGLIQSLGPRTAIQTERRSS